MSIGIIIAAAVVLVLGGGAGYYFGYDVGYEKAAKVKPQSAPKKIRTCPEHWYKDEMPYIGNEKPPNREYFIIDGKRTELGDVDVEWVKANCPANEPEIIH